MNITQNLDEFMCCEHPVGPMSSLDLLPARGALRVDSDVASAHPLDIAALNVTSVGGGGGVLVCVCVCLCVCL
jgi:hypothetical protein